ncbi:MAG: SpvB/TcaC N-terminal domain-containing protein [Pseudomonadota bacterium]
MVLLAVNCGGSKGASQDGRVSRASEAVVFTSDQARILGFESLSDWTQTTGTATVALSTDHVEGSYSLALTNVTTSELHSSTFAPLSGGFSTVDVSIEVLNSDPTVFGTVSLGINSPHYSPIRGTIGQVAINNTASGFQHYTVAVPPWINNTVTSGSGGLVFMTVAIHFSKPTNCRIDGLKPSGAATDRSPAPYTTLPSNADAILPSVGIPGQVAGRLSGSSQVDAAGAFNYRIPIAVPPGRAGMEPHLALAYSSSGTNGPLGLGWNVEGTSAIARCRKVVAREGIADSVKVASSGIPSKKRVDSISCA